MKTIRNLIVGLGIFTLSIVFNAPLTAQSVDSIVQITAEVQGLEQVTPDEWTPCSTYWEAIPGSAALVPLPCPPSDITLPVYSIAENQYLVDGSNGELPRGDTVSAMETVSNAVVNLINQIQGTQIAQAMRAMGMDLTEPPGFGDGGDGDAASFTNYYFYSINTNLLWLQITNASAETAYVNLYNATDQVYAIWSTTNLAIPLSLWQVETEVFPTNNTTNRLPFTVPMLGRQDLFLRAQDWTGVWSNGLPDWWMWYYFQTLDLTAADLDSLGNTLGHDYTNHIDPDTINFTVSVTNTYVNVTDPPVLVDVLYGVAGYAAVLANDTNVADAVWLPFDGYSATASLGADGNYNLLVGLRGFASNAVSSWQSIAVTKNTVVPRVTITSPTNGTVSQLPVQFYGFAVKPLQTVTFDITNSAGTLTNQPAYLTGQYFDTTLQAYTTNYFQSDDLPLAGGPNNITIHATDWAGNTTNINLALNYPVTTNALTLTLVWPQAGTPISSANFDLQARVNDLTAMVTATVNGNSTTGVVDGHGNVWAQNLSLSPGANSVTLAASTVAGGYAVTNFTVTQTNSVGLVVDPLTSAQLNQGVVDISGSVDDLSTETVYVNGVEANQPLGGSESDWYANDVSVSPYGMAALNVEVYHGGTLVASETINQVQPPTVVMSSYSGNQLFGGVYNPDSLNWFYKSGGNLNDVNGQTYPITTGTNGPLLLHGDYNESFMMPWEFATINTAYAGAYPFYQSRIQTQVMLGPDGVQPAGTTNLYLVLASAFEFSSTNINSYLYGPPFSSLLNGLYSNPLLPNSPYNGDIGLPPAWLQIGGKTLVDSGETNVLSDPYGYGPTFAANWGATLVPVAAGQTPDVTPVATRVNQNWDYTFAVITTNVTLQIWDTNHGINLSAQTNTVIVGQQMNLTCQFSITNAFMTQFGLSNIQWTVPGYAISNYVVATDFSSAVVVTNFATNNASTVFYWVDGASNRVVQCSATVNGATVTAQAVFNVDRPTINSFIDQPPSYPTNCVDDGTLYLQLGDNNGNGDMDYTVDVFSQHRGRVAFVQLINRTASNGSFGSGGLGTGGQYWLDNTYPYRGPFLLLTYTNDPVFFSDNPGVADVASGLTLTTSCSDQFMDYIIFRPVAGGPNNNIFVPIGVVTSTNNCSWGWSASTLWFAGWSTPTGTVDRPTNAVSSYAFPVWKNIYSNAQ